MTALADVIPIKPRQRSHRISVTAPPMPEPARLYGLIVLTFMLHRPAFPELTSGGQSSGRCVQCAETWPCQRIRLAYRLREGF